MNFSIRASGTVMLSVFLLLIGAVNVQAAGKSSNLAPTLAFSHDAQVSPHVRAVPATKLSKASRLTSTRLASAAHVAHTGRSERTTSLVARPDILDMTTSLSVPMTMQYVQEARLVPAVNTQHPSDIRHLSNELRRSNDVFGVAYSGAELTADRSLGSATNNAAPEGAFGGEDSHLDSLLLSLAVAGLIIMQLRRKQKTLPQRPLGPLSLTHGSMASGANS